jgi:DNA topoisomerase IB
MWRRTDGPLRDPAALARIKSMAIPPAYTDEWMCPIPNGHLQATGRDGKGRGSTMQFEFRGKSGKTHRVALSDRRLARIVARCQALPSAELFQYVDDDGERVAIGSGDVNDYLREITGEDFTAKDFRNWAGTLEALANGKPPGAAAKGLEPDEQALVRLLRTVAA